MKQYYHYSIFILVLLAFGAPNVSTEILFETSTGDTYSIDYREIIYYGSNASKIDYVIDANTTLDINQTLNKVHVIQSGRSIDEYVVNAQNNGALAVICLSTAFNQAGFLKYRWTSQDLVTQVAIPVFDIGEKDADIVFPFFSNNSITRVTISPSVRIETTYVNIIEQTNPWEELLNSPGYYIWQVFLCMFPAANMGLIVWKLIVFTRYYGGFKTSVALYILLIELAANIIRIISSIGMNRLYPEVFEVAMQEFHIPFALASYFLLTLFWHEMMTKSSVVVHPFVTKMKIPFFVISAVLLAIELLRLFLRSFTTFGDLSLIPSVLYFVSCLGLVVFYVITAAKLLKRLRKSQKLGKVVRLKRTTVKLLISSAILALYVVATLFFLLGLAWRSTNFIMVWQFAFTVFNAGSLLNILAFETRTGKSSKTSKTSHSGIAQKTSVPLDSMTAGTNTQPDLTEEVTVNPSS